MSTLQRLVTVVILSLCACLGLVPHSDATTPATSIVEKEMALWDYLRFIGAQTDTYFTVETVGQRDSAFEVLRTVGTFDVSARAGDDIVRSIEKGVSGVKVVRSDGAGIVYHIYGPGTRHAPAYWLDKKITLSYSGVLGTIFEPLRKASEGAVEGFEHVGLLGSDIPEVDYCTPVAVEVSKTSVRDAITCCLPFSQRDRILWACGTRSDKPGFVHLAFGWRAYKAMIEPSGALVPFEQGELACRDNPDSAEAIAAAAIYITEHMRDAVPLQVRWAMLYLGKHRAAAQMPLLFKHLDYRYTTCGVVEEQYPAVRALTMFGDRAIEEAVKQLKSEQNGVRLELLQQLIACIAGKDKAAALMKAQVLEHVSPEQQALIKKAIPNRGPTTLPTRDVE
jgi:hypothetical protein